MDWVLRTVPTAVLVFFGAYIAASQTVSPHRRIVKLMVLAGTMAFMFRFDMVYSVYLFILLFPFPSGISVGSTNNVLMTLIPLVWAVRASSAKLPFLRKTPVDAPIILLLTAYVVSLFNVDASDNLIAHIKVMWRQITAVMCFYMISNFVNNEDKLRRATQLFAITGFLVMLTGLIELFFPGRTIIPGWIGPEPRDRHG